MTIAVEVLTSIDQLDAAAYLTLRRSCAGSAFYDPRFLAGVERSPLLPVEKTFYLAAYDGPALVGFMPVYLQSPSVVDPFDVLRQTTSARFAAGARGLFSHVMHCYDTTIITTGGAPVLAPLFEGLAALAKAEGAQHFVLMNVAEGPLLAVARELGLEVNYMFDTFHLDLSGIGDFDALVSGLPSSGRHEMRRQLRKFEGSGARAVVEIAPFARLVVGCQPGAPAALLGKVERSAPRRALLGRGLAGAAAQLFFHRARGPAAALRAVGLILCVICTRCCFYSRCPSRASWCCGVESASATTGRAGASALA